MIKLIFNLTLLCAMTISQYAFSIQIIPENRKPSLGKNLVNAFGSAMNGINNSRIQRENEEFNRIQEQQQLMREQVRIQQEMLDLQKHQHYFGR